MQGTFALFDVYTGTSWTLAAQGSNVRALQFNSQGTQIEDTQNRIFGLRQSTVDARSVQVLDAFDATNGLTFSLWIQV